MTHSHMHYKASEMNPILKPVMVQNNADYCQINGQTFNENSVLPPRRGAQPIRAAVGWSLGHVYEVWGDLLQQLP